MKNIVWRSATRLGSYVWWSAWSSTGRCLGCWAPSAFCNFSPEQVQNHGAPPLGMWFPSPNLRAGGRRLRSREGFSPPDCPHPAPRGWAEAGGAGSPRLPPRSPQPSGRSATVTSEPTSPHSKEAASRGAIPSSSQGKTSCRVFATGGTKEPRGRSPSAPALGLGGQWEGRGGTRGWGWR